MINADYKDATALANECIQKSETANVKAKRIEHLNEKIPRVIGLILQTGVLATFLYILIGTEIVRDSVQSIISQSFTKKIPDVADLVLIILPLFYYALTIGFIGVLFIKKKKRVNYRFYLVAILIQTIVFAMWINNYRSEVLTLEVLACMILFLFMLIIPGAILGIMKKRTATITVLTFVVITLMSRYGYHNGWFDDYRGKKEYADGMVAVEYGNLLNRKWGFMDENGKEVVPCIYSDVLSFSEGLAAVRVDNKDNSKWGFIGKDGNEIIPFKYDAVESFSDGLAKVKIGNEENGKWGYIDKSGKIIISLKYEVAKSFSDGYAQVGKIDDIGVWGGNIKWGLIDKRGNFIIPFKYSKIGDFNGDLAIVNIKKKESYVTSNNIKSTQVVNLSGVINRSGKEVIAPDNYYSVLIRGDVIEVKADHNANIQYFDKSGNRVNR